jgi:hypothetical protein
MFSEVSHLLGEPDLWRSDARCGLGGIANVVISQN